MEKGINGLTCKECGFAAHQDEFVAGHSAVLYCPKCFSRKLVDSSEIDASSADESAEAKPVIIDVEAEETKTVLIISDDAASAVTLRRFLRFLEMSRANKPPKP